MATSDSEKVEQDNKVDLGTCGQCGEQCKTVLIGYNEHKEMEATAVCYDCDVETISVLEKK